MASWTDIANYLRSNYTVAEDSETFMRLNFNVSDDRTQSIIVARGTMDASEQEWATIASVFAKRTDIDLAVVLREVSEYVVGGLAMYGENLAIRHAVPLGTLDLDEFTEPFKLILHIADALEQKFIGADNF